MTEIYSITQIGESLLLFTSKGNKILTFEQFEKEKNQYHATIEVLKEYEKWQKIICK